MNKNIKQKVVNQGSPVQISNEVNTHTHIAFEKMMT